MKVITKRTFKEAQKLVRETNNKSEKEFALFERQKDNYNVVIYKGPEIKFLARRIINTAMSKRISPYGTSAKYAKICSTEKSKGISFLFSMGE